MPLARKQSESTRLFKVKIFNPLDRRSAPGAFLRLLKEQRTKRWKLLRFNERWNFVVSRKIVQIEKKFCKLKQFKRKIFYLIEDLGAQRMNIIMLNYNLLLRMCITELGMLYKHLNLCL